MSTNAEEVITWCLSHDLPPNGSEPWCTAWDSPPPSPNDCEFRTLPERENRCVGDCGRHTTARFKAGTHGPGPYCGWCEARPDWERHLGGTTR